MSPTNHAIDPKTAVTPTQAQALAARIPAEFIKQPPQGKHGTYVSHDDITQIALALVGPFDFEVTEVIRGFIPEKTTSSGVTHVERPHGIVGALCKIGVDIDGRYTSIQEVGEANSPEITSDGGNLKTAASDGIKRCFMRLGLGLELWVEQGQNKSTYYLPASLAGEGPRIRIMVEGEETT